MAKLSLSAIVIMLMFSCSLDYSEADLTDELSEEIPDTIIYDYESVEIRDGSPVLRITAGEAEFYNRKEETHLTDVRFYNYRDEKVETQGRTERAVLQMKSGDASLTGSIEIESADDDSSLKADSLQWIDDEKKLSSGKEDSVSVTDKEGSKLTGTGFSADIRRNSIIFNGEINGEFHSE